MNDREIVERCRKAWGPLWRARLFWACLLLGIGSVFYPGYVATVIVEGVQSEKLGRRKLYVEGLIRPPGRREDA